MTLIKKVLLIKNINKLYVLNSQNQNDMIWALKPCIIIQSAYAKSKVGINQVNKKREEGSKGRADTFVGPSTRTNTRARFHTATIDFFFTFNITD